MRRTASLVLASVLAGCSGQDTLLLVVVRSDYHVPDELRTIDMVARDVDSNRILAQDSLQLWQPTDLPLSFTVAPDKAFETRKIKLDIAALGGDGDILSERRTIVGFVKDETRMLDLIMAARCAGLVCGDGLACNEVSCVPQEVDVMSLPIVEHGEELTGDAGLSPRPPDGGDSDPDATSADASVDDATAPDATATDSGDGVDAPAPHAAATTDTRGGVDATAPDAGVLDATAADTGPIDAGMDVCNPHCNAGDVCTNVTTGRRCFAANPACECRLRCDPFDGSTTCDGMGQVCRWVDGEHTDLGACVPPGSGLGPGDPCTVTLDAMNMPTSEPCNEARNLHCHGFNRFTGEGGTCTSACREGETACAGLIAGTECQFPSQLGIGHCGYPFPTYTDLGKRCNDNMECMSGECTNDWFGDRCTSDCMGIRGCGFVGRCVIFGSDRARCLRLCSQDSECNIVPGEVCDNDRGWRGCYPPCDQRGSCPMNQACQPDGHCR